MTATAGDPAPMPITPTGPCDWVHCPKWAAVVVARQADGDWHHMRVCLSHHDRASQRGYRLMATEPAAPGDANRSSPADG